MLSISRLLLSYLRTVFPMYDSSLCCLGLKMPYKLFRTSYSHNSVLHSHIVKLTIHFYAHIRGGALSHKTSHMHAHRGFRLVLLASYNSSLIPSAIALRIMQQEVAPASSTPLDLSPRRLERPNFATMSFVESRPASAAAFISASASLKSFLLLRLLSLRPRMAPVYLLMSCLRLSHQQFHTVRSVLLPALLQDLPL